VTVTTVAPVTTITAAAISLIMLIVFLLRRYWKAGLVVMALATACGDNEGPTQTTTTPGTPAGSYDFTVTATAGTVENAAHARGSLVAEPR
jgi:hypothetical protein